MFNLLSLGFGVMGFIGVLLAFIPLLGWANWFIIPFAVIGLLFGMVSSGTSGRNLNLIVIAVGALRLMLGGGIF